MNLKQKKLDRSKNTIKDLIRNSVKSKEGFYLDEENMLKEINSRRLNIGFFITFKNINEALPDDLMYINLSLGYMNPITMQNSYRLLLNTNSVFGQGIHMYSELKNYTNKTLFFVKNTCANLKLYKIKSYKLPIEENIETTKNEIKSNLDLSFKEALTNDIYLYKTSNDKDILILKDFINNKLVINDSNLSSLLSKLFNIQEIKYIK